MKSSGAARLRDRVAKRSGGRSKTVIRIPWAEWRSLAKAIARLTAGVSAFGWWRRTKEPPVPFPYRRWRQVRSERLRRIQKKHSSLPARCECGHAQGFHTGRVDLGVAFPDGPGTEWKLLDKKTGTIGTCAGCECEAFREVKDQHPDREPGDDVDAYDDARDLVDERQVGDGARAWTIVPPAWKDLSPLEASRLVSARRRALECRTGKALELEHTPCGSRWWVRFGCRTRLCGSCGQRYRGAKRDRFEPLARLHVDEAEDVHPWAPGGSSDALFDEPRETPLKVEMGTSSLKFVTLTFPDNVFVGPKPEGHVAGANEIRWENPTECREWFRAWTKKLRHFIGPSKAGKKQPSAPPEWGVRGYLAVWEVTAEKVCGECSLGRSKHVRGKDGKPGAGVPGGRDKAGNMIRKNDCTGWKNERRSGRFHPHLHLLVWSRFIPIEDMRSRWKAIGGGGQIRLEAAEGKDAVDYILKYLAKPWAGVPDDLQVVGLYRMRRVTSCGAFYGKAFTELTATVLEPAEKTRAGIFCATCRAREAIAGGLVAHGAVQSVESLAQVRAETVEGEIVSEELAITARRRGAFTDRGVEISDLRTLGKPEKGPPEWRTVKLRLIPDIPDSVELEPARFGIFAWNGVMLSVLSKKLSGKVFEVPTETAATMLALEDEKIRARAARDDCPF